MKLDWDDLRDELEQLTLNVEVTPTSIKGHPAIVVLAPVAPLKMCDSLRALLLAKDLEIGSVAITQDQIALRHVILACGCSKTLVIETAKMLVDNAKLLASAVLARPSRMLRTSNVHAVRMLATD